MVIRPKWDSAKERDGFISNLQYEALGKLYDFNRVVRIMFSINVYNLGKLYNTRRSEKIVCSHEIFRVLKGIKTTFSD